MRILSRSMIKSEKQSLVVVHQAINLNLDLELSRDMGSKDPNRRVNLILINIEDIKNSKDGRIWTLEINLCMIYIDSSKHNTWEISKNHIKNSFKDSFEKECRKQWDSKLNKILESMTIRWKPSKLKVGKHTRNRKRGESSKNLKCIKDIEMSLFTT